MPSPVAIPLAVVTRTRAVPPAQTATQQGSARRANRLPRGRGLCRPMLRGRPSFVSRSWTRRRACSALLRASRWRSRTRSITVHDRAPSSSQVVAAHMSKDRNLRPPERIHMHHASAPPEPHLYQRPMYSLSRLSASVRSVDAAKTR